MKAVKNYQREQAKKHANPTLTTKSQTADTTLSIPETLTIPNTKKVKISTSDSA